MIRNPDFRAAFDTDQARTDMSLEVRRLSNRERVTFRELRAASTELRPLTDGQLTEIAQNLGLDVQPGAT